MRGSHICRHVGPFSHDLFCVPPKREIMYGHHYLQNVMGKRGGAKVNRQTYNCYTAKDCLGILCIKPVGKVWTIHEG